MWGLLGGPITRVLAGLQPCIGPTATPACSQYPDEQTGSQPAEGRPTAAAIQAVHDNRRYAGWQ